VDDTDPVTDPQPGDRPLQERRPPFVGVEQRQLGRRPLQGEDEAGQAGAGPEVERQCRASWVAVRGGETPGVLDVRPDRAGAQEASVPRLDEDAVERCGRGRRGQLAGAMTM
jgi:hypothetical protein